MDEREKILTENFEEYFHLGNLAFREEKYNSATTLYFKAISALFDLYLFRHTGSTPSSHTHRFRILEKSFPKLYLIADRDFPFYQDSYTHRMSKEAAEVLREDAYTIKEMAKVISKQ